MLCAVFLAVCVALLPLLRFPVVYGVTFVAAGSCCCYCLCFCLSCCFCCFVAAFAAGAFKSPTVEKRIFARFCSKMFLPLILLFVLLCCCCFYLCCCLYNLLLLVRLVVVAAFFCFCLHCYVFFLLFVLLLLPLLGSLTVEKPTLAASDLAKSQ